MHPKEKEKKKTRMLNLNEKIMDTIINGVWTSEDSTGKEVNRYFFSPDGVYRYDVRLDDDTWHTARHGHYLYAEKMLSLQYSDGIWYNMGYVGAMHSTWCRDSDARPPAKE